MSRVAEKVWTAEELDAMTPAEQDAIFEANLVTDLSTLPDEFLEGIRARTRQRIENTENTWR
jgi:hypothetical protein